MPRDPEYYRRWRRNHPEYVERERERGRRRSHHGDRRKEYAKRASRAQPPLQVIFPELQHGTTMSFWQDELRIDLAQERELAILEGRDPVIACREYSARETEWFTLCGTSLLQLK